MSLSNSLMVLLMEVTTSPRWVSRPVRSPPYLVKTNICLTEPSMDKPAMRKSVVNDHQPLDAPGHGHALLLLTDEAQARL